MAKMFSRGQIDKKQKHQLYSLLIDLAEIRCLFYVEEIRPQLHMYRMPPIPIRPANLSVDDNELIEEILIAKEKKDYHSKGIVISFGMWRNGLIFAEMKAASNLELLFIYIMALDQMGWIIELEFLKNFIIKEYCIDPVPIPKNKKEIKKISNKATRQQCVMPDNVLKLERNFSKIEQKKDVLKNINGINLDFFEIW
jgi:hypothetical protein